MTQPTPPKFPVEPPHLMTPAQYKRFTADFYQGQAALAAAEARTTTIKGKA